MYIEKINIIRKNGKCKYTVKCQSFARSSFDKDSNLGEYLKLYRYLHTLNA